MTKMIVDLRKNETLYIGGASVRLEQKSGQVARLVIEADNRLPIHHRKPGREAASSAQECAPTVTTGAHNG